MVLSSLINPAKSFEACRRLLLLIPAVLLVLSLSSPATAATSSPERIERLAAIARLWGTVRYLHPHLAYREIDWDAALIQTIPHVRVAKATEEYAAAAQKLLDVLGDPITRVRKKSEHPGAQAEPPPSTPFRWVSEGVLAMDARSVPDSQQLDAVRKELPKARAVVLDLRDGAAGFSLEPLAGLLTSQPIHAPPQRHLLHSGYLPQLFQSSGGYYSGFLSVFGQAFRPSSDTAPERVVFVVDSDTAIPPLALALQAAGKGWIVAEGPVTEQSLVRTRIVSLGENLEAVVRVTELVPIGAWTGFRADQTASRDDAFLVAVRLATHPGTSKTQAPMALPEASWLMDKRYDGMLDPPLEYRLLAVFRFWNIIHFFYPYKHLIGDWNAVLSEFIEEMEKAQNGRDYALGIAKMTSRVHDGHTDLWGHPELNRFFGEASAPISTRWIENAYVVTAMRDDVAASGLEVGDILLSVDGQPLDKKGEFLSHYLSASTESAMKSKLAPILLAGPRGSAVTLGARGRNGTTKGVKLQREPWTSSKTGEVVKLLPHNLAYADLTRLTLDQVDDMFERFRQTRGIIFDMRGYPNQTGWVIAARLNRGGSRHAASFRRPLVSGMNDEEVETGQYFLQPLPTSEKWKYPGKTVMLIDERTISQAEHTGLLLEAANGTEFIGAPSAGTNGDVTSLSLPGGIVVRFTGNEVRHADGRQLQRIGLIPHLEVSPTVQGIREGRDEVLERAIEYLSETH